MRKDYRLGAIVGVYILFKNNSGHDLLPRTGSFRAEISNRRRGGDATPVGAEIAKVIIEEVFNSLTEFKNQDPLLIKCELEVIGLLGSRQDLKSAQRLSILKNLLTDQQAVFQQEMVLNVLVTMI